MFLQNKSQRFSVNDLNSAIQKRLTSNIKMYLSIGDIRKLINKPDEAGKTPLHYAMNVGKVDIINELLENGADIHAIDNNGETPFSIAIKKNLANVINKIVETWKFSDSSILEVRKDKASNPIYIAVECRNNNILNLLCKNPLFKNFINKYADQSCAQGLIKFTWEETPLSLASKYGSSSNVKTLLDAGANPNLYTKNHSPNFFDTASPLWFAINSKNFNAILLLVKAKANLASSLEMDQLTIVDNLITLIKANLPDLVENILSKKKAKNFSKDERDILLRAYYKSLDEIENEEDQLKMALILTKTFSESGGCYSNSFVLKTGQIKSPPASLGNELKSPATNLN